MALITQQSQPKSPRYACIPAWLRNLDFVTDGFTWLFRLLSRGAESLMTLSTIYIIIEAGVPVIAVTWLHNLAVAIMISAPEIILPGGFILASETRAQGNRRWWMLAGMCWIFVILTGVTLADLFIWRFSGEAFAALMWGRCAAAVGYSILFRVITYRREVERMPVADVQATIIHLQEQVVQQVQALTTTFDQQLQRLATEFSHMELSVQQQLADVGKGAPAIDLDTLAEAVSASIETPLQATLEAFLRQHVTASSARETPQRAGTRNVSRTQKRDAKAGKAIPTARGKNELEGDPETVVYRLLEEDASRTHRVIAKMTGIPDTTVYRIRKRYLQEQRPTVSPAPAGDETAM